MIYKVLFSLTFYSFMMFAMEPAFDAVRFLDATSEGDIETVKKMLEHPHANVNVQIAHKYSRQTPLMVAILPRAPASSYNHEKLIKLFLKRPELDCTLRNQDGWTALHHCVFHDKSTKPLELLLEYGPKLNPPLNINERGQDNCTAINVAVNRCNLKHVQVLLKQPGINLMLARNWNGSNPLHNCVRSGGDYDEIAYLLLEHGLPIDTPNAHGKTAFDICADRNNVWRETMPILLAYRARINSANDDHQEALQVLIETLCKDFSQEQKALVLLAIGEKNPNLPQKVLSWFLPNEQSSEQALFNLEALVNTQDSSGFTPFMWAAARDNRALVKGFLTLAGCNGNMQDKRGNTALHWAVRNNNKELVKMLAFYSPLLLSIRNNSGETPLMLAKKNNLVEIATILTEALAKKRVFLYLILRCLQKGPIRLLPADVIKEIAFWYH